MLSLPIRRAWRPPQLEEARASAELSPHGESIERAYRGRITGRAATGAGAGSTAVAFPVFPQALIGRREALRETFT